MKPTLFLARPWLVLAVYLFVSWQPVWAENGCIHELVPDGSASTNVVYVSRVEWRSTLVKRTKPEYVDLAEVPPTLTGQAVNVNEHYFTILNPSLSRQFNVLITEGIISCAAVVIHDRSTGSILLSHFLTLEYGLAKEIQKYVTGLEREFVTAGGSLQNADITVVWGRDKRTELSNQIETLMQSLSAFLPKTLRLDSTRGEVRSIDVVVNIQTGEVFKTKFIDERLGQFDWTNSRELKPKHEQNLDRRSR